MHFCSIFVVIFSAIATANTDPADHIFFTKVGEFTADRGNAHVSFRVNITAHVEHIQASRAFITKLQEDMFPHNTPIHQRGTAVTNINDLWYQLDDLYYETMAQAELARQLPKSKRAKRQFLEFFTLASSFLGVYNTWEISQIKDQVEQQRGATANLFHAVSALNHRSHEHGVAIHELQQAVLQTDQALEDHVRATSIRTKMQSIVTKLRDQTTNLHTVVDAVLDGRLSTALLNAGALRTALGEVAKKIAELGYELLPTSEAEAYQCPASFIMEDGVLTIILHVPMAKETEKMDIFKFLPVPIPVGPMHMTIDPLYTVIAVSADHTYFHPLTEVELNACQTMGSTKLCEKSNFKVLAKITDEKDGEINDQLCTWYLFKQEVELVKTHCPMSIRKPKSMVIPYTGTSFIFVSATDQQGLLRCYGESTKEFSIYGVAVVQVDAGCTASTKYFEVTGVMDIRTNASTWSYTLPFDPKTLLSELDLDLAQFHNLTANAEAFRSIPTEPAVAAEWLKEQENIWNKPVNTGSALIWIGVGDRHHHHHLLQVRT